MVKIFILAGAIALALMIGTASGAKLETTIEIGEQTENSVSFDVTRSFNYDKKTIWVKNQCWDAEGDLVISQDAAVLWGTTVSLVGITGEMPTDGVTCTAYITLRPWQNKSHNTTEITFDV